MEWDTAPSSEIGLMVGNMLRFEHAQHAAEGVFQQVVGPTVGCVEFKLDLLWIEQIPAAEFERLVDEDA